MLSISKIAALGVAVIAMLVAAPAPSRAQATDCTAVQVGTAVPAGRDFQIKIDDRLLAEAYANNEKTLRQTGSAPGKDEFKKLVYTDATRKLHLLFPGGLPEAAQYKIKISIYVTFKPPGGGVSIEW